MSRIPAPEFKRLGAAPSAGDLKGFLDYVRSNLATALTTIASHTATLATHTSTLAAHTVSLLLKADKRLDIFAVSTTTYTLISSTAGALTQFTNASGCSVTVNSAVFTKGDVINLVGTQAQITLVQGSGVTIHTPGTLLSRAAYSPVALVCLNDNADSFLLTGDLDV